MREFRGPIITEIWTILPLVERELLFFCAMFFLIFALDDLLVDCLYAIQRLFRRIRGNYGFPRLIVDFPNASLGGTMAIFLPAWDEAAIIGRTLDRMARVWDGEDFRVFIGLYRNDAATQAAVRRIADHDDRFTIVIVDESGPTSKGDCLNRVWRAMLADERRRGNRYRAVLIHDAEDIVHPDELRAHRVLLEYRAPAIQLPVIPLRAPGRYWVGGHYCDEFAEAHGRDLPVREWIGASMPTAGVGCSVDREVLGILSKSRGGRIFDAESKVEDYELGFALSQLGYGAALVHVADAYGQPIATRAHFPHDFGTSVRQKSRWVLGIALSGWDRLGWTTGWRESWMRMRDRRAVVSAVVLFAAYFTLLVSMVTTLGAMAGLVTREALPVDVVLMSALASGALAWRLGIRAMFVAQLYGWREALLSIPRAIIGNLIAICAAFRAARQYAKLCRGRHIAWDKTPHVPIDDEQRADAIPDARPHHV